MNLDNHQQGEDALGEDVLGSLELAYISHHRNIHPFKVNIQWILSTHVCEILIHSGELSLIYEEIFINLRENRMRPCPIIVRAVFAEARENIHPLQADRCLMTFTSTHTISTLFLKIYLHPSQYSEAVKRRRKKESLRC